MEGLVVTAACNCILVAVIRRNKVDGFPLGRNRFMLARMTRNIAVLGKRKEPGKG